MNRLLEWWYRKDIVVRFEDLDRALLPGDLRMPWRRESYPRLVKLVERHVRPDAGADVYDGIEVPCVELRRHNTQEIVYRVPRRVRRTLPADAGYSPDWRVDETSRLRLRAFAVVTQTGWSGW